VQALRTLLRPAPALAVLSGTLIYLSYPPADLGSLALVALVPLMVAIDRSHSYGGVALLGSLTAAAAYLPALAWVGSVAVAGWLGLSLYLGFYVIAAAVAVRFFQQHFRSAWPACAAAVWAGLELLRARFGPGFPWLFIGYTQYSDPGLLQLAAFGGVFALTFLVVLFNAAVAAVLLAVGRGRLEGRRVARGPLLWLGVVVPLVAGCAIAGRALARNLTLREGPVVGVVQQNIPRLVSEIYGVEKSEEEVYDEREEEIQLAAQLSSTLADLEPRLVAWPETTVSLPLNLAPHLLTRDRERRMLERTLDYLRGLGSHMGSYFLVGAPTYFPRGAGYVQSVLYGTEVTDFGNSAVLFDPRGSFVDRYDKMRLVPFGEYIPLRDLLPFLAWLTPIGRELTPGDEEVIFEISPRGGGEPVRFGALVCYEDVFPDLTAAFRRKGARFFVNITDEGWYHIPGELRQHLAMAVFRAVETRTTMVRAANTGISCFINPRGEIYARLPALSRGSLAAPVMMSDAITPYVRLGDLFGFACLAVSVVLVVAPWAARRLKLRRGPAT
jgi:apolipoprotein N-acyltransferase